MDFRPCDECTACCDGQLISNSHGNAFGEGKKCIFLVNKKCTIYETRPETCKKYQCAWSQSILDEDMRPDKCGLIVSVEVKCDKQFLKVIEIWPDVPYESYKKIQACAKKLNTNWVRVGYNNEYDFYNKRWCGKSNCSCSSS